jgi:diaminopimelate epimerase
MAFETLGGDQQARVEGTSVRLALAVVDLSQIVLERELDVSGMALRYSFLTVGVPHAVIFPEDPSLLERQDILTTLGKAVRNRTDLFPLGTNVNFARSDGKGLDVVTYERGVEEITLSCGTGSTASAIVGRLLGRCGDETEVRNPGGINRVSLVFEDKDKVRPFLTGRAALVAWAKLPEEALA